MSEEELAAREAELVRMFTAFSDKPDADRLRVYLEELAEYPWRVFRRAVRSALRNQESPWAPSIGKIRSCARPIYQQLRQIEEERREKLELEEARRLRLPSWVGD